MVLAKVASISTSAISCSRPPLVPLMPSLPTIGANLRLLCSPVHPTNIDFCEEGGAVGEAADAGLGAR